MEKIKTQWYTAPLILKVSIVCLPWLLLLMTIGVMTLLGRQQNTASITQLIESEETENQVMSIWDNSIVEHSESDGKEDELHSMIYVDIKGAILYPNVYALPLGSRLFDAITLAGGLLPNAATQTLNQAQLLTDQSLIYIYSLDELEEVKIVEKNSLPLPNISYPNDEGREEGLNDTQVNINSASLAELQTLPGIGPKKAEAIIQYREQTGSFNTIEALLEVSGIGDKTFEQLMSLIRVD